MTRRSGRIVDQIPSLDRRGEAQWQRLRRQLELSTGFWLGFLFCQSPSSSAALRWRAERFLQFRSMSVKVLLPDTAAQLRTVLRGLLEPPPAHTGLVWLEAIRADSTGFTATKPGPWTAAWDEVLLRLNERREVMRRHLQRGVVIAAPLSQKPRARDAAPDLWSILSLMIELQPSGTELPRATRDHKEVPSEGLRSTPDEQTEPRPARLNLRRIGSLLTAGKSSAAATLAQDTVAELRGRASHDRLLADSLEWLSRAERAEDDVGSALAHLAEAIQLRRRMLQDNAELPTTLRDLSLSLRDLGRIRRDLDDLEGSRAAYGESLALCRRLIEMAGETPQALRDLAISVSNAAHMLRATGNLQGSSVMHDESLQLRRRLVATVGEAPQALRDLSVGLENIGLVHRNQGDLAGATAAYEESLAIRRRLVEMVGETPQTLRDLSISLNGIANLREDADDLESGLAAAEESVVLDRRLVKMVGETWQTLRDLSVSLSDVGRIRVSAGDLTGGTVAHKESVALDRRSVELVGQTPQTLQNLGVSLRNLADALRKGGDVAGANAASDEARVLERLPASVVDGAGLAE